MIDGFSIAGYRSFGPEAVKIAALSKVNIFIGPNNCGKSNILRFVGRLGTRLQVGGLTDPAGTLDPLLDYCQHTASRDIQYGLQIRKEGSCHATFSAEINASGTLTSPSFDIPPDLPGLWFDFHLTDDARGNKTPTAESLERLTSLLMRKYNNTELVELQRFFGARTSPSGRNRSEEFAAGISAFVHDALNIRPTVHKIGEFRRISDVGGYDLSGSGLIKELKKLRDPLFAPSHEYDAMKKRFAQIVHFLRTLLGNDTATLEMPQEADEIYVRLDGTLLPLSSYGTGLHELVILAAAVTTVDDAICCIEEPEIHLHPKLQKEFIQYILNNTNNQYLITSHSNAFFDMSGVNIYRCRMEDGLTQCTLAASANDKHALLAELGYRPSDLLLANYVIWVEGPSDRIYINHWLKTKAPELEEGLHYSIMFYGGSLLSHLAYDSKSCADEFIRLCRLNRNAGIVIDSDKDKSDSPINDTKIRVESGFAKNDRFVWVTDGRTIENYVTQELLNAAIEEVHPKKGQAITWEQFVDLSRMGEDSRFDKVPIARHVALAEADFSKLDLDEQISSLIEEIRKCNGTHALNGP
jgi:putative AbiEii toxin of type IV toxin-antitoxin system